MYSQVKLSLNKDGDCGLMFWRGFVKPQTFQLSSISAFMPQLTCFFGTVRYPPEVNIEE